MRRKIRTSRCANPILTNPLKSDRGPVPQIPSRVEVAFFFLPLCFSSGVCVLFKDGYRFDSSRSLTSTSS